MRVVVVVGGSPLHFVLRTSLGLRNVNEVVEGVAYGRSLRVCDLEGSGGGLLTMMMTTMMTMILVRGGGS